VNANQVFHWRKLYREGRLGVEPAAQLVPVRISVVVSEDHQAPTKFYAGVIIVEVGRARIRVEGAVDTDSLRLILERLGRGSRCRAAPTSGLPPASPTCCAQLSMLLEGIDWRRPLRTTAPQVAV
jgi:transposase